MAEEIEDESELAPVRAAWFYGTGAFDLGGCLIGFASAALTVGGELLGRKSVNSHDSHPKISTERKRS
jgi:hypothetical protein